MFIAIIGTKCAGKSTVQDFLAKSRNFTPVRLLIDDNLNSLESLDTVSLGTASTDENGSPDFLRLSPVNLSPNRGRPISFLLMNSPVTPSFPSFSPSEAPRRPGWREEELAFRSEKELLDHVTRNWRSDFVTTSLNTKSILETFATRPFFLVVSVDAPIYLRYQRNQQIGHSNRLSLDNFVQEHDLFFFGQRSPSVGRSNTKATVTPSKPSFQSLNHLVNLHLMNSFESISSLYRYLEELDLSNPERLRPGWDTYFMELASLASLRSNCMKRRVGAILVRNKRILATGYNGTPRGLTNCNEGGCTRCNSASETSDECVCLHAEENALLEAGRERVGDGAVLYCNTCPCLKCTIKIIQIGVREVVYNLSYKVDDASAALFRDAGVVLRRHAPPPEQ